MTPKTGQHAGRNLEVPRVAACTGLRKDLGVTLPLFALPLRPSFFSFSPDLPWPFCGRCWGERTGRKGAGRVPTVVEQYVPRFSFGGIDELRRVRCDVCCCVWCTFALLLGRGGLKAGGGVSLVSDVRYLGVVTGRMGCRRCIWCCEG